MPELWLNEKEKVHIPEITTEKAVRNDFSAWRTIYGVLENPDHVLKKTGNRIDILRVIESEGRVGAAIRLRKAGFFEREYKIESGGAGDGAVKFIEEIFEFVNIEKVMSEMLDYFSYGFAVSELIWKKYGNDFIPSQIIGKPQEWFRFDKDRKLVFLREDGTKMNEIPYKFLLLQNEPSYMNPYGKAMLSLCFWAVTFKKGGIKFWAQFVEKFGMPNTVGKLPRSADTSDRANFLSQLTLMVQNGVSVIPDDGSVELLEAAAKGDSANVYGGYTKYHDSEIAINILGHEANFVSTGGNWGNQAPAEKALKKLIKADVKQVTIAVNTLIRWIFELNPHKLDGDGSIPKIAIYDPYEPDKTLAERDQILTGTGVRFNKKYFIRNHGLSEDEFEVTENLSDTIEFAQGNTNDDTGFGLDGLIDTVEKIIKESESFEEAKAKIIEEFGNIDNTPLAEMLEAAVLSGDLSGRANDRRTKH